MAGVDGGAAADPAAAGLHRVKLDLGQAVAAIGPTTIPGTSTCRSYYIFSYRAAKWVAEEQGFTGNQHNMLRARSTDLGSWEKFGVCSYNYTDNIYLEAPSGYLVSAEFGFSGTNRGMLRGRASWPDVWEVFEVWGDSSGKEYLRNATGNAWVSVRVDMTGNNSNMVRASASSGGLWEQLDFIAVN